MEKNIAIVSSFFLNWWSGTGYIPLSSSQQRNRIPRILVLSKETGFLESQHA